MKTIVSTLLLAAVLIPGVTVADEFETLFQEPASNPESRPEQAADNPASANGEAVDNPVAPATPASRRGKSRLVEEIVVTAQKREQNLQDVPISVQSFSADALDARGILDQRELQLVTPALEVGTQVSYVTIYMRGVGTDAFLTADPSVATYIDGIYFPFAQGLAQDFGVLDRVEVLKGPQGTLFGRNATGGALNIITQDPDLEEFGAQLQLTSANYPDFHTKGSVNIPIGDSLALGLSGIYSSSKFFVDGTAAGLPLKDDRERGARIKLRWAPTTWMDTTLSYFKLDAQKHSTNFTLNRYSTDLMVLLGADRYPNDEYNGAVDGRTFNNAENEVFYGTFKFFTPWFDIKLLGSDQFIDTQGRLDFDGTDTALISFSPEKNFADIQTGELQLISNDWGPEWLEWIGGLYYFQGKSGFDPMAGEINAIGPINDLLSLGGPILPGTTNELEIFAVVDTLSESAFAQARFTFTEWFDLTLGLRLQKESRKIAKAETNIRTSGGTLPYLSATTAQDQNGNTVPGKTTTRSLSPKVSLDFRPFNNDNLVYLSYQEATKSATYNVTLVTGPPTFADSETIHAWELGTKTQLFDGLVTLNGAIFYYDINDLQVQFLALSNGGVVSFENAEEAQIRGLDFDFVAQLFPSLIDDLVLLGGAAWLKDAEYSKYPNGKGFNDNSGIFTSGNDYSGNRIVRSAEYTGNLSLSKTWFIGANSLETTVDLYYNDGFFYEASNNPRSVQDAYHNLGARISYLVEDWNLRATLFGRNLTDEFYTQGSFPTDFGVASTVTPPRTYGLRLSWEY